MKLESRDQIILCQRTTEKIWILVQVYSNAIFFFKHRSGTTFAF